MGQCIPPSPLRDNLRWCFLDSPDNLWSESTSYFFFLIVDVTPRAVTIATPYENKIITNKCLYLLSEMLNFDVLAIISKYIKFRTLWYSKSLRKGPQSPPWGPNVKVGPQVWLKAWFSDYWNITDFIRLINLIQLKYRFKMLQKAKMFWNFLTRSVSLCSRPQPSEKIIGCNPFKRSPKWCCCKQSWPGGINV